MNVLVACEESQRVAKAFEKEGAVAFSCDIQKCSGNRPDIHILSDCTKLFKDNVEFITEDGVKHYIDKWDILIAHPPCTYFSSAGARWLYKNGELNEERYNKMLKAKELFFACLNAPIKHIAVENPTPMKICNLPKHSCVIQPYQFGEPFTKRTLLWLKNLPPLNPTNIVKPIGINFTRELNHSSIERSKTFYGIANAMAEQWYTYVKQFEKR